MMRVVIYKMGSYANFKSEQINNKNNVNMLKRSMQIVKKEELDASFEERLIDWTTFYR